MMDDLLATIIAACFAAFFLTQEPGMSEAARQTMVKPPETCEALEYR